MEDTVRNFAVEWQDWASGEAMSYAEVIEWQSVIEQMAILADESGELKEELEENGIL